jgi:hypothetical protein
MGQFSRSDVLAALALLLLALSVLRDHGGLSSVAPFDAQRVGMGVLQPIAPAPVERVWQLHQTPPPSPLEPHPQVWAHVPVLDDTSTGTIWERSASSQLFRDDAGVLRILRDPK